MCFPLLGAMQSINHPKDLVQSLPTGLLHLPIQNAGGGARPLLMHKAASTSDRRKQLRVEKMRQLCQISAKQPQSELLGWFYFCKKQTSGCLKKQGTFFSWRALLFFTKKLLP